MLYLPYGVYRTSLVYNNVFRRLIQLNTRNWPQYTKKGVIRTPGKVEDKTICDAGLFSNKIIFLLTPNNQL